MKRIKTILIKIIFINMIVIATICTSNKVDAVYDKNAIKKEAEAYAENIDVNNITKEDILNAYDEVTSQYSSEEIVKIIEENKEEIKKQGVSEDIINAGEKFIKETDTEQIREIIKNDIDIEDIKNKLEQGYTPNEILTSIIEEMPTNQKVEMAIKFLLANRIVKTSVIILIIWLVYSTIIRWIIYSKAGKPGWAAIIPIYRQIVMYQVCRITPLFMLLWFIPILGWIVMFVMAIVKRFSLASSFGRSGLFGFGLLILPPIFQAILAFNPNIKYEELE